MLNYTNLDPQACEFVTIAPVDDVPNGQRLFLEIDNVQIVILNIAGEFYAIEDVCSHDDGPLGDGELDGKVIVCPRHGARFDVRTGKALSLPAIVDIRAYPIRIVNGEIELGLPIE